MTGLIVDLIVHYFSNEGSLLERELDLDLPLAMAGDPLQVLQIIAPEHRHNLHDCLREILHDRLRARDL